MWAAFPATSGSMSEAHTVGVCSATTSFKGKFTLLRCAPANRRIGLEALALQVQSRDKVRPANYVGREWSQCFVCLHSSIKHTDTPYHWDTDIKRTEMDTRHWERENVNKCQSVWQTEQSANAYIKHRCVVQREHSTLHIQQQKPLLQPNNQYKHAWNHRAFSSHIKQDASHTAVVHDIIS